MAVFSGMLEHNGSRARLPKSALDAFVLVPGISHGGSIYGMGIGKHWHILPNCLGEKYIIVTPHSPKPSQGQD